MLEPFVGKAGIMSVTEKIRMGCLGGILDIDKFTQTIDVSMAGC